MHIGMDTSFCWITVLFFSSFSFKVMVIDFKYIFSLFHLFTTCKLCPIFGLSIVEVGSQVSFEYIYFGGFFKVEITIFRNQYQVQLFQSSADAQHWLLLKWKETVFTSPYRYI